MVSNVLVKGKGKLNWKTASALVLYANVLYRRILEIPELKVRGTWRLGGNKGRVLLKAKVDEGNKKSPQPEKKVEKKKEEEA